MTYQKVIIIAPGRSGTNMLRDILTSFPTFDTWPCDEINYIWRHGNRSFLTDEFTSAMATPVIIKFINNAFDKLYKKNRPNYVVEKTCANSLRVGFINKVVLDAKFVYLIRDGRDVVPSAMKRWTAPLDIPYLMKKAKFVPPTDLPYYAIKYLKSRLSKFSTKEKRLSTWGPKFVGMDTLTATRSLPEICAAQWARCVERAEEDFSSMDKSQVIRVHYETFLQDPVNELRNITNFLGFETIDSDLERATSRVNTKSIGKWKKDLDEESLDHIMPILKPWLKKYKYIL